MALCAMCCLTRSAMALFTIPVYRKFVVLYSCIHSNDSVQCKVVNVAIQFELDMPGVLFLRVKCMHRDDVAG